MHVSVRLTDYPIEFINITPVNPLISKCQIKVCYVGEQPNRNRSIITKDVARQIANSLPGSPIVGYYNEDKEDFEEHNRIIDISNGEFKIKDTTRPYGFVDLNAKVWFAKYLDDESVEREYLVTEGWLWTGQYPECERVMENNGNNHSMELDDKFLKGSWTEDNNGDFQFFIINEAIISKLCILGEKNEPCFEGSHITAPEINFSYDEGFKEKLFSLMNSIQELLSKGGTKVFTRYNVNIGDALWNALFSYVEKTFPDGNNDNCSIYRIDSICEEGGQKFAILQHRNDSKYYRLNFEFNAESTDLILEDATLIEITSSYNASTEPQFSIEEVEAYENEYKKNSDKKGEEEEKKTDDKSEGEEKKCPKCGKPEKECTCEEEPEKKYSLEEIPEYIELQTQYSDLETRFNALQVDYNTLQATVNSLSEFKAKVEKKDKEAMIAQFYMLSDEDKKDVIDNIDTYSLEDIESKLSVICVRNKVSFDNENNEEKGKATTTFTLETEEDETMPAWVKRAMSVAKTLK